MVVVYKVVQVVVEREEEELLFQIRGIDFKAYFTFDR